MMNGFHVPFLAFDQALTPNRVVGTVEPWGTAGAPDIGNDETGPWIHRDSNMRFNGDVNKGLPWAFNGS